MLSHTVLDSLALGYEPVWNRERQLAAVRLCVHPIHAAAVDAAHLMQALGDDWPESAPVLVIAIDSPRLLQQALSCAPVHNTWLEAPAAPFEAPETLAALSVANRRGHRLVRRTDLQTLRQGPSVGFDVRNLLQLSPQEATELLQAQSTPGLHQRSQGLPPAQLYQGVQTQTLARHLLDDAGAWGLLGWPDADVLLAHRHHPVSCDPRVIRQILQAINDDCSLERLERLVRQDPVLVYRILLLVNSAAYGGRHEIGSLRHALMMLGFRELGRWLFEQAPGSETDNDLQPVRAAMVMRARLAQHLLATGSEDNLRLEVYTTALFAQLDKLLHTPLAELLHKLPLSGRLYDAVLRHDGPYHPLLDVARAQGEPNQLHRLSAVCDRNDVSLEQANRALIRMLATSRDHAGVRSERMV
ncbi:MAG: HDOD domain-containing protein [Hydrogenophaga sp.]|uniref:HDOD domain-containing protein n=1 Tax=Hydrogenophaga sp. TaxID=1904254 RepID=UPI002AB9713D|nr:HDOD domain-containing protein [Hydrogenophaga sp.]MDZ4280530.1 HDOD domain-containing protein [Hydrogenophaga sp.]